MKVLIIEDEPRAANQLKKSLKEYDANVEVVAVIDTVEGAVDFLKMHTKIPLIFMDIQLADGLSFEIFKEVEVDSPIVFTTAFDQYAIQAFKVNSIDYLLKPIKKGDLELALKKFKKNQNMVVDHQAILQDLMKVYKPRKTRVGILVKEGGGFRQIFLSDLLYIYVEEGLVFGVTEHKRYVIDETIESLTATLSEGEFFRINRGQVVARTSILRVEPYLNHRLKLIVANDRNMDFIVSRQRANAFKQWLNG